MLTMYKSQAQNNLLEVILKAQASMMPDKELSSIKANMDKVGIYNTKLMSLKATMSMLTGRSKQLKDRAAKLQQLKIKYLSEIDAIRQREREKDQSIAAKTSSSTPTLLIPSPSPSPSPATTTPVSPLTAMPSPSSPAIPSATTSSSTIPKLVKKKKKTKARQALIDDGDDGRSWTPNNKKSLSQQDLLAPKK
ncbi:hypothetical protein MBANPS3_011433 [Mucor bainieri]